MTFPEGKDIFSFEIQRGDFTLTSPKFKIAVQTSMFSPDNKFIQLQKQRLNNGYHSCNVQQQNSPLTISAFNQIWIAMIKIMMNNNFDS